MNYDVRVVEVDPEPTAVVAATTTWAEFPTLWGQLSGEVWACLRAAGINRGCPNVMLYLDDTPSVEIGVLRRVEGPLTGRVTASTLPTGRAATTVHKGPYAALGDAHDAVLAWCAAEGLHPTRRRWEIYGPHNDDPAQLTTQVFWQID